MSGCAHRHSLSFQAHSLSLRASTRHQITAKGGVVASSEEGGRSL